MSHIKNSITMAIQRMSGNLVAIRENDATMLTNIHSMLSCEDDLPAQEYAQTQLKENLCAAYGLNRSTADKPFAFSGGLAIIPIHGTLINRYGGYYYGYITGYNFIRSQFNAAVSDPDVTTIIFDVNSNGGEAAGCFELSDEIYAARGSKQIISVVDSNCYSAAYALASAADKMSVTPSGGAGSIGVISMHVDISAMLDNIGVKITTIKSGDHKADGSPYEPMADDVKKDWQNRVDGLRGEFVSLVARNRDLAEKVVYDTEARCYNASEALNLGLIDVVSTPSKAVNTFVNGSEEPASEPTGESAMSFTQEEMDAARKESATAERTRISAIMGCDEAKDRPKMASYIALQTDMSADQATGMLANSALETKAEPVVTTTTKADADRSPFNDAMNKADHPEVKQDENNEQSTEAGTVGGLMSAAAEIHGKNFNA